MRPIHSLSLMLQRLTDSRRAATAAEYGLIAALVVVTMIAALRGLALLTVTMWNNVSEVVVNGGVS